MRKSQARIVLICLFLFLIGSAVIFYQNKPAPTTSTVSVYPMRSYTPTPTVSTVATIDPTFATGLPILPDLGLVKSSVQGSTITVRYFNAGTIPAGTYKGYKRIIAEEGEQMPGGQRKYLFATKDDKTYIVHGNPENVTLYPSESDWNNPYYNINKQKVTEVGDLLASLPEVITLDETFALFRSDAERPYTQTRDSNKKDSSGYPIWEEYFVSDFSAYHKLPMKDSERSYFYKSLSDEKSQAEENVKETRAREFKNKYLDGMTEVIVKDSQGLAYTYTLTTSQKIKTYLQQKKRYDQDYSSRLLGTPTQDENIPFPDYPGLSFSKSDITSQTGLYDAYSTAFPGACGGQAVTYIVRNVSDSVLQKVGSLWGRDVYSFQVPSHELNWLEFHTKIEGIEQEDAFLQLNRGKPRPTLDSYTAKPPLLFMKDYWGRLVVFGEYDYRMMGGCGKPVIYLYPQKTTEVKVMFDSAMQFDANIPTYHHGWDVLARPDGTLTDLQPQFTDCDTIDSTHVGSEYAKDACATHTYPYLYWSGRSLDHVYPSVTEGWVVRKSELADFMSKTLDTIGFTKQEKTDMLSYWIPAMLSKQAPYYRVAFLQTAQMNSLVPMTVTPRPDSIYRLFLDWSPLVSKPATPLTPQVLSTVNRHGFTLVEWGGLKQ